MRPLLYLTALSAVVTLAYWAYQENFQTKQALDRVGALRAQIAEAREALGVQRAEWAYLNRPDRLRELVEMNYDRLQLLPLTPGHFADIEQVAYPQLHRAPFFAEPSGDVQISASRGAER